MKCQCGGSYKVIDTAEGEEGIRRRRECIRCKKRVWTLERIENADDRLTRIGKLVTELAKELL